LVEKIRLEKRTSASSHEDKFTKMTNKEFAPINEIDTSGLIVFVGQSGAGKTTITKAIGGEGVASSEILRREVALRSLEDTHANIHAVAMDLIAQDPAWQALSVFILQELFVTNGLCREKENRFQKNDSCNAV
jgi:ABC-type transport system involved in cytochrome bd biosynthesis fused ATPase/permease subunit